MILIVLGNTSVNFLIAVWEACIGFKRGAILAYRAVKECRKRIEEENAKAKTYDIENNLEAT